MSREGNRTYVVLSLDEEEQEGWLAPYLYTQRTGEDQGNWYHIPIEKLRERWRGVKIHDGAVSLEVPMP